MDKKLKLDGRNYFYHLSCELLKQIGIMILTIVNWFYDEFPLQNLRTMKKSIKYN